MSTATYAPVNPAVTANPQVSPYGVFGDPTRAALAQQMGQFGVGDGYNGQFGQLGSNFPGHPHQLQNLQYAIAQHVQHTIAQQAQMQQIIAQQVQQAQVQQAIAQQVQQAQVQQAIAQQVQQAQVQQAIAQQVQQGQFPLGQYLPGQFPQGQYLPGQFPQGQFLQGYNRPWQQHYGQALMGNPFQPQPGWN